MKFFIIFQCFLSTNHNPFVSFQIMCKLVTMLSKDTVERLLLMRFCELCSDARLFQVRKVTTPKHFQFLHFCFSYCSSELLPVCKAAFYLYILLHYFLGMCLNLELNLAEADW